MSIYDVLSIAFLFELSAVIARSLFGDEAIQFFPGARLDCRVASLLAMTSPQSSGTWASLPSCGGGPMVRRSTTNRNIMKPETGMGM